MHRLRIHTLTLLLPVAMLLPAEHVFAQRVPEERLLVEKHVGGLQQPTAFVFLGPRDLLALEKNTGRVRHIRDGQIVATVLDLDVSTRRNRGGLGLEIDPEFEDNGFVYVYYSAPDEEDGDRWSTNILARYRWDGSRLGTRKVLLTFPRRRGEGNNPHHQGGALRFGPDGYIYGLVGDLHRGDFDRPRIEQNTGEEASSHVGGIFRIDRDGSIPEDNPFADHPVEAVRKWFVYGFRNGFGLDFDPRTGRLWFTEDGPDVYDELNVAEPGMNSGWRLIMGPDERDARYKDNDFRPYDADDLVHLPGSVYRDPAFSWLKPVGVTAVTFLGTQALIPRLHDRIVVGDTNTGSLYLFHPRGRRRERLRLPRPLRDTVADDEAERRRTVWGEGFGIVTELRVGPDGALYVADFIGGTIWRIRRR